MDKKDKVRFPWVTISAGVLLIIGALIGYKYNWVLWLVLLIVLLSMIGFIIYGIYKAVKNDRRYSLWRNTVKVGDETDEGTIMDIVGDEVTIAKVVKLDKVYPPASKDDVINLI